jgi:hypothetical protein
MNQQQLKKNVGQQLRLRPVAMIFDIDGNEIANFDDKWILQEARDASAVICNVRTGHGIPLPYDYIYSWSSGVADPGESNAAGVLMLKGQVILQGVNVMFEPVSRPGEPLRGFKPARRSADVLARAALLSNALNIEAKRQEFQGLSSSISGSDAAYEDIVSELQRLADEIKKMDPKLELTFKPARLAVLVMGFGQLRVVRWHRRYSNTLHESALKIETWDSHPEWPGYQVWEPGHCTHTLRYVYDLGEDGQPGWIGEVGRAPAGCESSAVIAARVIDDMMVSRAAAAKRT